MAIGTWRIASSTRLSPVTRCRMVSMSVTAVTTIGDEVTVVEGLKVRYFPTRGCRHWSYVVSRGDGNQYRCKVSWLRKKPPPSARMQELGEWELCPWNPYRQHETVEGGT